MKLFLNILLISIFLMLCACSNEEMEDYKNSSLYENSELITRLSYINDSIQAEKTKTRSECPTLDGLFIAASDCAGAYELAKIGMEIGSVFGPHSLVGGGIIGGIIGGVGASWGAYVGSRSSNNKPSIEEVTFLYNEIKKTGDYWSKHMPNKMELVIPAQAKNCELIGPKHNAIVEKALLAKDIVLENDRLVLDNLDSLELYIVTSPDYKNSYNNYYKEFELKDIHDWWKDPLSISDLIICYFHKSLISSPSTYTDVEALVNKYLEEISNSKELDENEKIPLYCGIIVAASSVEYWNELLNK